MLEFYQEPPHGAEYDVLLRAADSALLGPIPGDPAEGLLSISLELFGEQ